jgi:diguanylate cyclase (GGDEF)-like protein
MANRDPLSEQSPELRVRVFLPAPSGPVRALPARSAKQNWRNIDSLLSRVTHTRYRLERAAGYAAAVRAIAEESHDVLVVGDGLDNGTAINLLREAAETRCAMPIILITGEENAEIVGWAIEAGAMFGAMPNRAITQARGGDRMLALMLVDLDRFTLVNETMGYAAGDTLLCSVTDGLCDCTRAAADRHTDMLARVGNDEFALALEGIESLDEAAAIAERISGSMAPPFDFNGHEIFITTSLGNTTYPLCGWNADTLTNSANTAVHRAKKRGRNPYQFYTRKMTARELQRLVLQTSPHRALERREFQLYYQPQIGLGDSALIGAEADLRLAAPRVRPARPGPVHPARRFHHGRARGSGPDARSSGPRAHREHPDGRYQHVEFGPVPFPRYGPARIDRRFRDRLFLAHLPQALSARRAQD